MKALSSALAGMVATVALAFTTAPARAVGETAVGTLKRADGTDIGTATFTEATAGVLIKFDLKGLPPGPHAVKVHESGKCDGDFNGTGAIYNPLGAKHGFLNDEGPMAGDLPNLYAGSDGTIVAEILSPFLTLSTEAEETLFDAEGSAVVIFEKADDYRTEPDGAAGSRIACGKISIK